MKKNKKNIENNYTLLDIFSSINDYVNDFNTIIFNKIKNGEKLSSFELEFLASQLSILDRVFIYENKKV